MNTLKIGLAQINPVVGDVVGNSQKILESIRSLIEQDSKIGLIVFSELVLCGYPPKDLLLRSGFVENCDETITHLAEEIAEIDKEIGVLIGHPTQWNGPGKRPGNAASLLCQGEVVQTVCKQLLPNYDVFDERRYFHPAGPSKPIEFQGLKLGVHICEDAWYEQDDTFYHVGPLQQADPIDSFVDSDLDLLVNLSASPFEIGKLERRIEIFKRHAKRCECPFLFVNQIGGNDDLVFDGQSLVLDENGKRICSLNRFEEDLKVFDLKANHKTDLVKIDETADLLDALILGVRDYAGKCGFKNFVLGLSGGIDSAVAAYIAARALQPENVHCLLMPSRYSSEHSVDDSIKMAKLLGLDAQVIPIDDIHRAYELANVVDIDLENDPAGLADQNLQARIRGALVMIRSNTHGWLPLATGNKSELAVGYCTLYGDMAGGFAVLADVFKKDVYALARYINSEREKREVIPENIITKPPSAELAPDQFDQDSLPPYPVLDAILEGLIEEELSVDEIAKEHPRETVEWVIAKLDRNEFKRRQMAPGIKLSPRAFGSGRRMPMAARVRLQK